jgi:sigma-E factor negative regulatory protein RseA
MNEELDSQLSAMFDNELPAVQCELLARRLSRDEELKARWGRYAAIGATIRAEGGARLTAQVAQRVSAVISSEPPVLVQQPATAPRQAFLSRLWMPLGGVAVAASVAAGAILWVRYQSLPQAGTLTAQVGGAPMASAPFAQSPTSYVVPKAIPRRSVVPSTQLANYVVAHSEFSSPVNRRNILSALMASESGTAGAPSGSEEPSEDVYDDAKSAQ